MGIEYESVVDHPLAEVFAWHTRPGAMTRLVPPWQPMTVVAETRVAGRRAGRAAAAGWTALGGAARSIGFRSAAPIRRRTVVAGPVIVAARGSSAGGGTRMSSARRPVGTRVLRPRRHLSARRGAAVNVRLSAQAAGRRSRRTPRAADAGARPMVVAVTGASGLVGSGVVGVPEHGWASRHPAGCADRRATTLSGNGIRTARHPICCPASTRSCTWRARRSPDGSPMRHKAAIRDSRIEPTRRLADAAALRRRRSGYLCQRIGDRLLRLRPRRRAAV